MFTWGIHDSRILISDVRSVGKLYGVEEPGKGVRNLSFRYGMNCFICFINIF